MRYVVLPFAFLTLTLGGCAIKPFGLASCNLLRRELAVTDPAANVAAVSPPAASGTLAHELGEAVTARSQVSTGNGEDAMLFMSGGGQHGAFGAGLLAGWQEKQGKLPPFAVVTGVSTGSILATYAFIGDGKMALRGYTIDNEDQLLKPYVKAGGGKLGPSSAVMLLRRGAIANLEPLRVRLGDALTADVLTAVAKGSDEHRKLFVGAVDVDSGEAVAFDLTDLARRWRDAGNDAALRKHLKTCYIEAIVASSSAPIAAPPVFIDGRMYMDGGARFGVFSDEIGKTIDDRVSQGGLAIPPTTYVIINGDQKIDALCPSATCSDGAPPPVTTSDQVHRNWTFLDLALRSESILVNQVYRFSAEKIEARAANQQRLFQYFKIQDDLANFEMSMPDTGDLAAHKCAYWKQWDIDKAHPVQFDPHYMRCVSGYGRSIALAYNW